MLSKRVKDVIRDVPNFPIPGIVFKDITPVLADIELSMAVGLELANYWKDHQVDGVIGIESRGFIFGMQLAQQLKVPFIPVRKAGKLPYETIKHAYDLEYGSGEMEMHIDAISSGHRILIHDDLLATGGTADAAARLVEKGGGSVGGFSFLINLEFLGGKKILEKYGQEVHSILSFSD